MTPFIKLTRDVATSMEHRIVLLQQPLEFFSPFFHGRTPTLDEKVLYIEKAVQRLTCIHAYENDLYHVEVVMHPPFIQLDIRRHDGQPGKNWRHFQQIKNELIGPEHEAIELFPAESRLVDTANQYHLWVHTDASFRFPVGFQERFVLAEPVRYQRFGLQQAETAADQSALPVDCVA
jgi:hypothetical protein